MKSVKEILRIIEDEDFKVSEYYEDGELCGYEIMTWTDGIEINMVHFIDLRAHNYADGVTAENIQQELYDIYNEFDADDEAVAYWNAYKGLHKFGLTRILRELEDYEKTLEELCRKVSA